VIDIEELGVDFFRQLAGQTPAGICIVDRQDNYLFVNQAFEDITGLQAEELTSLPFFCFFHPIQKEQARSEMARAESQGPRQWKTRIVKPSGEQRDVNAITIDVRAAGEKATTLLLFDVTDTLRLALKVSTLNAFALSLSTSGSIQDLLDQLSNRLVESTEATSSIVLLLEPSPSRIISAGSCGIPDPQKIWALTADDPVLTVFESGEAKVLNHLHNACESGQLLKSLAPSLRWKSAILVPLRTSGRTLGVTICAYRADREPDAAEVTFVNTLVGLAAVAVDHARLVALAQEQAVSQERTRLGRELHDSVSQTLYGIGLGAQSALEALNSDPAEAAESIGYILKLASGGLTEMRALLYKLRPESLAVEGLVEALRKHVSSLAERHKIALQLHLGEEPNIDLTSKHAVYRVAMEAVHNAIKHAQAGCLSISLRQQARSLSLTIKDDGHGFDPEKNYSGHHGLDSMQERILSLGGNLTLQSQLDVGTTVRATIPIPEPAKNGQNMRKP